MKLKKAGILGLCGVLAAGALAGCGAPKQEDGKLSGEVRYAFWDIAQQDYIEQCVAKFNEQYPDVKIILEPSTWKEYWTKLEAGATGGSIADVFWMNGPNIQKYAAGDILMDLADRIEAAGIDTAKYPQALVELYNVDGKQYALPKDFDTIGVWYNKKIFDEANVPYPTSDWTWEDMVDIARKLTKEDGSVYGISAGYNTQAIIYDTIFANGGTLITEDNKSGYHMPETRAGIQCWVDLFKEGVSPSQASFDETSYAVQFLSGRLAMSWNGSWFLAEVLDSDIKDDVGVAALPTINGKRASVIHGLGNCIYKGTKNPEAAWKWVEFLAGEEANRISAETGAAIPAYEGTADIWAQKHTEYDLPIFIEASKDYAYPHPASKNTAEWERYQEEEIKKAFNLQADVDEVCDTLAVRMDEVLANE